MSLHVISAAPPAFWKLRGNSFAFIAIADGTGAKDANGANGSQIDSQMQKIFGADLCAAPNTGSTFLIRHYLPGVSNPVAESLARVLKTPSKNVRVDLALEITRDLSSVELDEMEALWKEPAIERLAQKTFSEYADWVARLKVSPREDNSFDPITPDKIGLEFSAAELTVLQAAEQTQRRQWNRAEWELFAQTWSEHCKHKIFNAEITLAKESVTTSSLFKTKLRKPALKITEQKKDLYLSLFHDNAGVVRIYTPEGKASSWAVAAKMETHNSPSAISPYGGASTGIVGVHRDILGTGLGALPIANWDVLCFESPVHSSKRPAGALPSSIIRKGVLRGIQDGGNQSGIPTVQGSTIFDPSYAVKPLVFAGALGILPTDYVNKKAQVGDKLFLIGGATGADGLRGAVMSSRDIRTEDFSGSIVQVANPYTQRCLTDFLIEARDRGLLSAVTDNGAGGLASSVGEMATLTGGAAIDLSSLRLKFDGLLEWEKLLSESQERMTLATSKPDELKRLLRDWRVDFDELGELNDGGRFKVASKGKTLVDVSLEILHDACPQLRLGTQWSLNDEKASLAARVLAAPRYDLETDLKHADAASRETIIRRFDHEVQGRTLRRPYAGATQESAQEGSLLEIFEAASYVALGHGLDPKEPDIFASVLGAFDEAMKKYLLATGRLEYAGLLDNFSWPDPMSDAQSLWKLHATCDLLAKISEETKIPFVSGKDSMKNNDAKFRVLETLVVSVFGSALGPSAMPASYFLKEGQSVFNWKPLSVSITPSATSYASAIDLSVEVLKKLHARYKILQRLIGEKKIVAAKDYSSLCPLKSLFEMSLGRRIGLSFAESQKNTALSTGGSTLGALHLVFAEDFNPAKELHAEDLELVGTTTTQFTFKFNTIIQDLKVIRESYRATTEELWA